MITIINILAKSNIKYERLSTSNPNSVLQMNVFRDVTCNEGTSPLLKASASEIEDQGSCTKAPERENERGRENRKASVKYSAVKSVPW